MGRGKKNVIDLRRDDRWWDQPREATSKPFTVAPPTHRRFNDNECYTVREVAGALKFDESTIYDWTNSGKLRRIAGTGRSIRYLGRTLNEDLAY